MIISDKIREKNQMEWILCNSGILIIMLSLMSLLVTLMMIEIMVVVVDIVQQWCNE